MNTKIDIVQKHKSENQKPRNPMNRQHTHKALTNQKIVAVSFEVNQNRRNIQ